MYDYASYKPKHIITLQDTLKLISEMNNSQCAQSHFSQTFLDSAGKDMDGLFFILKVLRGTVFQIPISLI